MLSPFDRPTSPWLNKVPDVALSFWIIKVMSTTVGETGADFLAVNAGWGQGATRALMTSLLGKPARTHVSEPRWRREWLDP
ncbi:membrane protein [Burkholderia aenigmatica]|jgi:uncharacterized membrane-anchored protein|uniref:Membrane protein n=1 Tax=Burkholderia aenigmatica TaxID=2015348 RepID=A0A6P2Q598_9BURK|nr:hypothetical protein AK36_3907 [Burkholderia vietnamiensis LMG 10929]AOJ15863.1 hypothetical protein WJ02_19915 [Burkholderia vietnamiensis]VWC16877.1 membrane protein [Burkholderia aenigmatica]KVF06673.1 hypothetical protein WJ05_23300 [Burkholderia vietnamiensis]KVF08574.1 hypothetical protein WJ04_11810 [Burkholderia vietnamiensis]